jgi:mono/diheme cytochrome c family protein
MGSFLKGVLFTLALLVVAGLAVSLLGFIPTGADQTPTKFETWLASNALDASMERRAPRINNPLPPTDQNLIEGMKVYTMACAECHGTLDKKPSAFGRALYPPAPNLVLEPLDDPEWHIFYAVQHGVRNTGMPAWKGLLNEQQIWQVTAFLVRIEKLPPAVEEQRRKAFGGQ